MLRGQVCLATLDSDSFGGVWRGTSTVIMTIRFRAVSGRGMRLHGWRLVASLSEMAKGNRENVCIIIPLGAVLLPKIVLDREGERKAKFDGVNFFMAEVGL